MRNVGIIAHVDHGKTRLVEVLVHQTLDTNPLEREHGITIFSKNASIRYGVEKINLVDTPGHADFSGEVERILNMVDGVLLVVDSVEGVMPQSKYVLAKALNRKLKVIVVLTKIDRQDLRAEQVADEVLDLFIDLGDYALDSPIIFASAKQGIAKANLDDDSTNMRPLLDAIINYIPAPAASPCLPFQLLVSSVSFHPFLGKIIIGSIAQGFIASGQSVLLISCG